MTLHPTPPTAPAHTVGADPTRLPAWQALEQAAQQGVPHLRQLLAPPQDASTTRWTAEGTGLTLDTGHQRVTPAVRALLVELAQQAGLVAQRDALFRGDPINTTEGRAVLHVALRAPADAAPQDAPWPHTVQHQVQAELQRVCAFADAVRQGHLTNASGRPFTDVVNIGIGGSDLGPRMATEALAPWCHPHGPAPSLRVHYVSNPDAWALHHTLSALNPHTTLLVVSSKTFTTQETLANAASARAWLEAAGIGAAAQSAHLVAITAAAERAAAAGYPAEQTFTFWDWVGGRYSLWSALGLPLALAVGTTAFRELLAGAHAMDRHFRTAPLAQNLPVQMALLGLWNRNFLQCPTQLVSTYPFRLARFAPFVQQMDMESNGKRVRLDGHPCATPSGPIVWGGLGIDGQHAYFQLLHQGMHQVPVEFIGVQTEDTPLPTAAEHHRIVNLNLRAQAQALALGRPNTETRAALLAEGLSPAQADALTPHRSFEGNVPNSTLWLDALTPHRLGALVALYEHKVFTQAAIWGINAYDQWGVELGKTMAKAMERGSSR